MTNITKEQIWAAEDLPVEECEVPEWGGTVTVRTMMGKERDEFEAAVQGGGKAGGGLNMRGLKARLVQLTVVNGDGKLLFLPLEVKKLNEKSAAVLSRIADVALRMNGFSPKDVDELVGNSPSGPSAASGSD